MENSIGLFYGLTDRPTKKPTWSEKRHQKPVLKLYMQVHQHLDINVWYKINLGFLSTAF
jgi:hypothetical protein